jgi:hypothetical protein
MHTLERIEGIDLINVIYVLKDLVRMVAFRHTLEYIQVIHLINVAYVVKDLVKILPYRYTLECILVINFINVMYVVADLVRMVTYNVHVQTHIRIHTSVTCTRYKCHICGKVFSRNSNLQNHISIHTYTGDNIYIYLFEKTTLLQRGQPPPG